MSTGFREYHNIKPRTRAEREGMRDREAIERMRLKERSGGFHQYEEYPGISRPVANSSMFLPESERFDTDFAAEDKRRREIEYQSRQQNLNRRRDEVVGREVNRWESMENEEKKYQEFLNQKQSKWQEGQKNNLSAAYNPITLEYDTTEQGSRLKGQDDQIKYRAGMRMFNLDSKMNSEFNVVTGEPRRPPNLPPRPF